MARILATGRLLYHEAPLIILDEPTASLDPVGERQIFDLLATFSKEKIILFTTHRYDTIRKADRIVVLVDGHLVESGTHEDLARNSGHFWSLFLAQGSQSAPNIHDSAMSVVSTAQGEKDICIIFLS